MNDGTVCCVGECCGPGSFCCQNAGPHDCDEGAPVSAPRPFDLCPCGVKLYYDDTTNGCADDYPELCDDCWARVTRYKRLLWWLTVLAAIVAAITILAILGYVNWRR